MSDVYGRLITDDTEAKEVIVEDAALTLGRVSHLFDLDTALDELLSLAESGTIPHFVGLREAAGKHGVAYTPELIAAAVTTALYRWYQDGAVSLTAACYAGLNVPDAGPRRLRLLRAWLAACETLAGFHLGDRDEAEDAAEAFRALGRTLAEWDPDIAVSCGLNACSLAREGTTILAAADALVSIAGPHDDNAVRMALTYRVLGLARIQHGGGSVELELYDAFEAACRYAPTGGPARKVSRAVLGSALTGFIFLHPHLFLWQCVFDPDQISPRLKAASRYAQPVWQFGDDQAMVQAIMDVAPPMTILENQRLRLMPRSRDSAALTDLSNWSIDHRAFRQAIPFSSSLLREADRSDILLTLGHEVIHIQSALGWLGINLAALRTAATDCEVNLVAFERAASSEAEGDFPLRLAELPSQSLVVMALVEQQLELVRKSQLLRAVWLPWLEGVAVLGELSADPSLEEEVSSTFSDVISSLNDDTPARVAENRRLSLREASLAIRADAEKLYTEALHDSGRARLRTYLNSNGERYLAGYLAVRAVVTSLRRFHQFNGLTAYQALFVLTTQGTKWAIPSLTLSPQEFEEQARAAMRNWLTSMSDLDEMSVATLSTARRWKWGNRDGQPHVKAAGADDAAGQPTLVDVVPPLALEARQPRLGRERELGDLPPEQATLGGQTLNLVAGYLPEGDTDLLASLAGALNDRMSLVPIAHVTAPFWLVLGRSAPRLLVGIRVTETEREKGEPGYTGLSVPLSDEKLAQLQEQMRLLRGARMEVVRYADISQFNSDDDQGRGLGRNVIGFAYGSFTLVLSAGQLSGEPPSPSLVASVENRLRPPEVLDLDTAVVTGAAIAQRAIDWIPAQDFEIQFPDRASALKAWKERVLALARVVLKDDDAQLVREVSGLILDQLGWPEGKFEEVCQSGLRALYDDESPALAPLLEAVLASAASVTEADLDEVPEEIRARLFELTEHGYDLRRFQGSTP